MKSWKDRLKGQYGGAPCVTTTSKNEMMTAEKARAQRQPRVARIPSVIPGVEFDIRAIETHYQEMVVVRGKGG